jgi:hypothetical protein
MLCAIAIRDADPGSSSSALYGISAVTAHRSLSRTVFFFVFISFRAPNFGAALQSFEVSWLVATLRVYIDRLPSPTKSATAVQQPFTTPRYSKQRQPQQQHTFS